MKVLNQIKMFVRVLSFASAAIVLFSFVSNVVAEEKQFFNLGSVKSGNQGTHDLIRKSGDT